jgi:DNA ligase-1
LTETLALMWPTARTNAAAPGLATIVAEMGATLASERPALVAGWLDASDAGVRLALLKLVMGGARPVVASTLVREALAQLGGVPVGAVEAVWHGLVPPYGSLFAWLERRGPRPNLSGFQPFMLAGRLESLQPGEWRAERLLDGIRVQVAGGRVFSRQADDVTAAHAERAWGDVVLDGVVTAEPRRLFLFDILFESGVDLRALPFDARRARLEAWFNRVKPPGTALSELVPFGAGVTGVILKRGDSPYVGGRGHGLWWKHPPAPRLLAAVLLYAEPGVYTVGAWRDGSLVPVGKAEAEAADAVLLERWVRDHTIARFGPVREVEKTLVLSVMFDSIRRAPRRKAGLELRGARVVGLLPDRRAAEADGLDAEPFVMAGPDPDGG